MSSSVSGDNSSIAHDAHPTVAGSGTAELASMGGVQHRQGIVCQYCSNTPLPTSAAVQIPRAFLIVDVLIDLIGFRVGAPSAEEHATMLAVMASLLIPPSRPAPVLPSPSKSNPNRQLLSSSTLTGDLRSLPSLIRNQE